MTLRFELWQSLYLVRLTRKTIAGLLALQTSLAAFGGELSAPDGPVRLTWEEETGSYQVLCRDQNWEFSGKLPSPSAPAGQSQGVDLLGGYRQVDFSWRDGALPMTGSIRAYEGKPLVLFGETCGPARQNPPAPFPDFSGLPSGLHVLSFQEQSFAPPSFQAREGSTPWLLFDDKAEALLISPASHFAVASLFGDGHTRAASGFNPRLRNLPAGFSQQTLLAFGQGINRTWDLWGQSLNTLRGAKRPANDADDLLKYFSYWTDNGATYYYDYDTNKGYAGTLQSLAAHYRQEGIPLHCLQLDSWWYSKSFADADGRIGTTKQPRLPAGEWNRYGGLLEYKAHPFLFPNGLAEFQKSIALPLVTHNRWVDPASPYHEKYRISGVAAVDPKWWDDIADYLKSCGVATYEQDWLSIIHGFSPEFNSTPDTGETFLREMARACRERGITMQYCMAYPSDFMAGGQYANLTTIRVSDDRFGQSRWNLFLYTSRLASSMGIWPWSDVFESSETNNFLLATLSGGPVGVGDPIGKEDKANIFKSVRADGVIVKPDVPCMPLTNAMSRMPPKAANRCWPPRPPITTVCAPVIFSSSTATGRRPGRRNSTPANLATRAGFAFTKAPPGHPRHCRQTNSSKSPCLRMERVPLSSRPLERAAPPFLGTAENLFPLAGNELVGSKKNPAGSPPQFFLPGRRRPSSCVVMPA